MLAGARPLELQAPIDMRGEEGEVEAIRLRAEIEITRRQIGVVAGLKAARALVTDGGITGDGAQ